MAMSKIEVARWLETLPADAEVAIDEGGMCLVEVGTDVEVYCEVGGEPDEDDDEDDAE